MREHLYIGALAIGMIGARLQGVPAVPDRAGLDSVIGSTYRPVLPILATSDTLGGWLLYTDTSAPSQLYSIERFRRRGRVYVTFDSLTQRDGPRVVAWRVLDAFWLPRDTRDRQFAFGCSRDNVADYAVIAVVAPADAEWHTHVLAAWRADTMTRRFQPIAARGLRCRNDAWGVD